MPWSVLVIGGWLLVRFEGSLLLQGPIGERVLRKRQVLISCLPRERKFSLLSSRYKLKAYGMVSYLEKPPAHGRLRLPYLLVELWETWPQQSHSLPTLIPLLWKAFASKYQMLLSTILHIFFHSPYPYHPLA